MRRKRRRRPFGRRRPPETTFWIAALIVLGAGSVFMAFVIFYNSSLTASSRPFLPLSEGEIPPEEEPPVEEPDLRRWSPREPVTHMSILLLGLDDYGMSDAIMIFSYDLRTFEASLVSVKRDTYVLDHTWADKNSGQCHLAWASNRGMGREGDVHEGANLAALTVEDLLGIDIHAYAVIGYEGFTTLVDALGGVTVPVPAGFAELGGGAPAPGVQRLDGSQALIYARHRQNPRIPEADSTSPDGDRVRRNQRLLAALLEEGRTMDPEALLAVVESLEDHFTTSLADWDLLELINLLVHQDSEQLRLEVLPGQGRPVYEELIEKEIYYYFLDYGESRILLEELGLR